MKKLPKILEREQAKQIIALLPPREALLAELILRTGLRASEACRLRPADFNHDITAVRVNNGKGGKDRIVVIAQSEEFKEKLKIALRNAKNYIFETRNGKPIDTSRLRRVLIEASKKARLPFTVHPHTLRHTHATLLLDSGVNLETVREQLGHASLATTQIYLHLSLNARKKEMERVMI